MTVPILFCGAESSSTQDNWKQPRLGVTVYYIFTDNKQNMDIREETFMILIGYTVFTIDVVIIVENH